MPAASRCRETASRTVGWSSTIRQVSSPFAAGSATLESSVWGSARATASRSAVDENGLVRKDDGWRTASRVGASSRVPGHEDDRGSRSPREHVLGELAAAHPGHHHVGEQDIDRPSRAARAARAPRCPVRRRARGSRRGARMRTTSSRTTSSSSATRTTRPCAGPAGGPASGPRQNAARRSARGASPAARRGGRQVEVNRRAGTGLLSRRTKPPLWRTVP